MNIIDKPVKRKDHERKVSGQEKYVADLTAAENGGEILTGRLVRANAACGEILEINIPELPDGYCYVSAADAPRNVSFYPLNDTEALLTPENAEKIKNSMPLFADRRIEYSGQPVGMIVGPEEKTVRKLVASCRVVCREETPVVGLENATEEFVRYERSYGDPDAAFLSADFIYEESFSTGHQYQAQLEPQGLIAEPWEEGVVFVHGSLQCPYTVQQSVAYTLDCKPEDVRIRQDAVGGAFGGKEDFPSFFGAQVAVAALKTKAAVRVVLDRNEDLQYCYKRHPSITRVRVAVSGRTVTAMDIEGMLDTGAFLGSSGDVTMRYHTTFPGVYSIPSLRVLTKAMKTNTPPNGAFRGFGGPQSEFAMEMVMSHLADELGENELEFKMRHFAGKGTPTSTGGGYYFDVPLPELIRRAEVSTGYSREREEIGKVTEGRLKRGIGIAFANHGAPLGGNCEWELVKPKVTLRKHPDGMVELSTSQTELGQGVRSTFSKIAAETLGIPYEHIITSYPDTAKDLCSGITSASRSIVCVGKTVQDAAEELKKIWKEGEAQTVTAQYRKPDHVLPFDLISQTGNQYDDYSWSAIVVEVLVDPLSGNVQIVKAHGIFNIGTLMDENICRGQMEGGLAQAIGYSASERIVYGKNGKIFNHNFADYHIPSATDLRNLSVEFDETPYPGGPFGAKGAGEIPLVGVSAAYLRAMEQALGKIRPVKLNYVPFVPEDVINAIAGRNG